jgi:hypothetical protein
MNTSRKGGRSPAPTAGNPNSPFGSDGLTRLLAAAGNAPPAKLHVGPDKDGKPSLRVEMPPDPLKRFTLQRDGDRPLQFDGTELVCVESAGGPMLHRAAVYETKGGKFVAEFSSRPNQRGKIYNDPPRLPKPDELAKYREALIQYVIDAAEWRAGKAEQPPRDPRNFDSAEALSHLATKLDHVGVRDTRWTVLWLADYNLSDKLSDEERAAIAVRQAERKDEVLRGYRFYTDPPSVHPDLEAHRFLDQLIKVLEQAALPPDAPPATGKAQAFASLEEALAWFRPGRLTTELLKKLGRWDPEFVE